MSAKQLWKAYGILSAVTEVLEDKLNHPKIVVAKKVQDFSNQFYTLRGFLWGLRQEKGAWSFWGYVSLCKFGIESRTERTTQSFVKKWNDM